MNDLSLVFILQNITTSPEGLGITTAYSESSLVRYKQYGKYDAVAVRREGERLLSGLTEVAQAYDAKALRKWQRQYLAWQKKCKQLKFRALVHGEFNEAGKIILYPQAIAQECAEHDWDFTAYFNSVLVHERVHALHHDTFLRKYSALDALVQSAVYKKTQAYWFGAGANTVLVSTVKETLAEFVRYLWCKEQGQEKLAAAIPQSLVGVRAFYPSYPYAGVRSLCALYEQDAQTSFRLWHDLWQLSLTSWQGAYDMLKMSALH